MVVWLRHVPQQACVEVWYVDNQTTMSSVRFENNLCANTGDLGWSANQRPDPAGRVFCAYHNSAITTNLSVVNNIWVNTAGTRPLSPLFRPFRGGTDPRRASLRSGGHATRAADAG
jgi:hypothetical protein